MMEISLWPGIRDPMSNLDSKVRACDDFSTTIRLVLHYEDKNLIALLP